MSGWIASLRQYLPPLWIAALERLTEEERAGIRELRVRRRQPLTVSTDGGMRYLCGGGLTALRQPDVLWCDTDMLTRCMQRLCEGSVYAYQRQLRQGFITLSGGIRVGVAGRAIMQGQGVSGVCDVTSLCFRLPARHHGCGQRVLPYLLEGKRLHSAILVGEPASGKTTLLRDAAVLLAARGYRVTVVDERGELAGIEPLAGCDVLQGYPKEVGILQAIRCLSPEVVLFDELGDEGEAEAVSACANAGVAVVATLHGDSYATVACRPAVRQLIQRNAFTHWLFLTGRNYPGDVRACLRPEVRGHEICWIAVDSGGGDRSGCVCFPSPFEPRADAGSAGADICRPAATTHLYGGAYGTTVAAAGGD